MILKDMDAVLKKTVVVWKENFESNCGNMIYDCYVKPIKLFKQIHKLQKQNITHTGTEGNTILSNPNGELTGVPPLLFDWGDKLAFDALSWAFKATRARCSASRTSKSFDLPGT